MNLFHPCSKTLRVSLLAMLGACSGGLDREDGVAPSVANAPVTQAAAKDVACAAPDAGWEGGTVPTTDSGSSTVLSARPGDRCGPAGEGDFPWAPCDATRGLVCVPPDPEQLDEPSTCQCPAGKVFTEGACVPR
jgi:hypothetical protein